MGPDWLTSSTVQQGGGLGAGGWRDRRGERGEDVGAVSPPGLRVARAGAELVLPRSGGHSPGARRPQGASCPAQLRPAPASSSLGLPCVSESPSLLSRKDSTQGTRAPSDSSAKSNFQIRSIPRY